MSFRMYHESRQGNHPKNDDYALSGKFSCGGEEGYFLAVSDGVGSKPFGNIGSQGICKALEQVLQQGYWKDLEEENETYFLEKLHQTWLQHLHGKQPKDCGATALLGIILFKEVHLFRLGDGFLCGVSSEGNTLLEVGELEFYNETHCLTQEFHPRLWEHQVCKRKTLRGIVACTDGIEVKNTNRFARDFANNLFYQEPQQIETDLQGFLACFDNDDDKTIGTLLCDVERWDESISVGKLSDFSVYDAYGTLHHCTEAISQGGQGIVYRTSTPNIAIKFQYDQDGNRQRKDLSANANFSTIGTLPIPSHCKVTLPMVPLQDYAGYVMPLLEDMQSFQHCLSVEQGNYEGGNPFLDGLLPQTDPQIQNTQNIQNIQNPQNSENTENPKHNIPSPEEQMVNYFYAYQATGGKSRRLLAYYKLATIFAGLHSRALVYGDISPNNVFLSQDLSFTNVSLIDVDNLAFPSKGQAVYTPGYVAPEVKLGKSKCSFYSDDYSFALSLFYQLTGTHPFQGALFEETPEESILVDYADNVQGEKADRGEMPWIYDEDDDSNGISSTVIPAELILSKELFSFFQRCFSAKGQKTRLSRPSSFQWIEMLGRELDRSISCPHCHMDTVWDEETGCFLQSSESSESSEEHKLPLCPWCDGALPLVKISSYLSDRRGKKEGEAFWFFVAPWTGDVTFPLRLVTGGKVLSGSGQEIIDETLGRFSMKKGKKLLTQLSHRYQYKLKQKEGGFRKNAWQFQVGDSGFQLLCEDAEEKRYYLLEVEYPDVICEKRRNPGVKL